MTSQLRIYRIKPGAMDAFITLWRDHIVPARRAHAFTVDGAWVTLSRDEFAWIVSHESPEGFEAADRAYYASPERAALPHSPGEYIEEMQLRMMEAVSV
jgi:hypothetical protein